MEGLLNLLTALSLLLIVVVLVSLRRSHIRVEYSVSWLAAAVALLVLSRSHFLLNELARILGLAYAPLVLLPVVGCLFLLVLFRLSIIISRLKDANIALTQRLAILEFRIQSHVESQTKT
jgi:hypothetical protein